MNELDFNMREEVLEQCRRAIELADDLLKDENKRGIVHELARNIKKRAGAIEEKCSAEKFNLYFNGEVGVGKSTAICHLTGLVDKNCLKEGGKIDGLPLLKTASGRTTVCETRIAPTEGPSRIEITKLPEEEFRVYVSEFCDKFDDPKTEIPSEVMRVICNMSGFPWQGGRPKMEESDITDYLEKSGAEGLDITKENLFAVISRNINYVNRNLMEIRFSEGRFEDWLRELMIKINDGKIPEVPFPEQISA